MQREQAKQNIPDMALDYILTLEETTEVAWRFWRDVLYSARSHSNEPIRDLIGRERIQVCNASISSSHTTRKNYAIRFTGVFDNRQPKVVLSYLDVDPQP